MIAACELSGPTFSSLRKNFAGGQLHGGPQKTTKLSKLVVVEGGGGLGEVWALAWDNTVKLCLPLVNDVYPITPQADFMSYTSLFFLPDAGEVFDEASALLELEQLKKRVGELEKKLGGCKEQRNPKGLKFLVRNMSTLSLVPRPHPLTRNGVW